MEIVAKMGGTVVGFDSRLATGAVNDLTYTLGKYFACCSANRIVSRIKIYLYFYQDEGRVNIPFPRTKLESCCLRQYRWPQTGLHVVANKHDAQSMSTSLPHPSKGSVLAFCQPEQKMCACFVAPLPPAQIILGMP